MCFKTIKSLLDNPHPKQKTGNYINKKFLVFRPNLTFMLLILLCMLLSELLLDHRFFGEQTIFKNLEQ